MWQAARLWSVSEGAPDALGVPSESRADLGEAPVRWVPTAAQARHPDGQRAYLETAAVLLTPAPLDRVRRARVVALGGREYEVVGVADVGRLRALSVREADVRCG